MIQHIRAAALIAAMAFALPATAQQKGDWVDVQTAGGNQVAYDRGAIQRQGQILTVRTRIILAQATADGSAQYFTQYRYDCRANTYALLHITVLNANGAVTLDSPANDEPPEAIAAGSPNAYITQALCR